MRLQAEVIFFLLAWSMPLWAQSPDITQALKDIERTYNFEPSKMSFNEQAKRAPTLSALWDRYDKNAEVYREALQGALASPGKRELLYCDGGMLLLAKSKASEDLPLGLQSISKCSLSAIQHTPYFLTMHALALRGVDVLDLQFRILSKPDYRAYIVAHSLNLGPDYAFIYPLLVLEEDSYVPRLAARIKTEKNDTALQALVKALWYAATPQAEAVLKSINGSAQYSAAVRALAGKALEQTKLIRAIDARDSRLERLRERLEVTAFVGEAELRAKRRERMRWVSDEALIDLDGYTPLIYKSFQ